MNQKGEYAQAGVDYTLIQGFKDQMVAVGQRTLEFPNRREVHVIPDIPHAHGAIFQYRGIESHLWVKTQEGLGNLNWIAEWMYEFSGARRTYYDVVARAAALIVVIDVISQGGMPVVWTDEVAAGDSEWFNDNVRSGDYARGCYQVCEEVGMALPAGESPALRYLVKSEPPVRSAPTLSGSITGIIAPTHRLVSGRRLASGDHIIGVPSAGLHANGISLVIKRALGLPESFLTKLPTGRTLGEECLLPIPSYVGLVWTLLNEAVDIHAFLPGTGDGVGKLAFDKRPYTYRVHSWVEVPPLFQFMRGLGVSIEDCLKTFNWGIGFYIFVPPQEVENTIALGQGVGYKMFDLGVVEEGERKVIFEPEGVTLPPPGE